MLNMQNLSVVYPDGTRAVDGLCLSLSEGESVALIGANGAGKTSLLLSIVGVIPAQGVVSVNGLRLDKRTLAEIRSHVGVVFQNPDDQLFMPSIYEDIAFGLRNAGVPE